MSLIAGHIATARQRIASACRRVGRDPSGVRILAVGKTQPAEVVREAIGLVDALGENRVQEAATKRPLVGPGASWHLIGPLQRNKARLALDTFDVVETVDRVEIADRLEQLLAPSSRVFPVFLEVNIGGEPQKSGVDPAGVAALATHVRGRCPHLRLEGLMAVPPFHPDPELSRPHFDRLRRLAVRLEAEHGGSRLELSMGMSDDFEVAVEEGATWVRLGHLLFGERPAV